MVKKLLLLAVLALALPLAAFADSSIDITNRGGTLTGNASGLSLTGSTLISYGSAVGSNLGSLTFTTGAFTSGNAQTGGTLAAGGSFVITGNGTNGVPNGVIFSGTFSLAVSWNLSNVGQRHPQLHPERWHWLALPDKLGRPCSLPSIRARASSTEARPFRAATPTFPFLSRARLSLFGTGLIGLAGAIRRKLSLS